MKIVHVPRRMTLNSWGGTESVVSALAGAQHRAGHRVEVHTSQALDGRRLDRINDVPVHRHTYQYPWLSVTPETRDQMDRVGGNLFSFSLKRRLESMTDVDVLHAHTGKRMGGIVRAAALRHGVPYLVTLHGGLRGRTSAAVSQESGVQAPRFEWGRALGLWVGSRRVLQDAAAVTYLSPEDAPVLDSLGVRRAVRMPNGVHTQRFAAGDGESFRRRIGVPADARLALVVGRVDPQKNQASLMPILRSLVLSGEDLHLAIVGPTTDESYRTRITAAAERLGMAHRVHMLDGLAPESPQLAAAYHGADVVLVPSLHEPFGIVILEAWAAGTPVVANGVGGIPTFARDGHNALLVEPTERHEWVRTIRTLLQDPGLAAELSGNALREVRARFDWDNVSRAFENLYDEVSMERAA